METLDPAALSLILPRLDALVDPETSKINIDDFVDWLFICKLMGTIIQHSAFPDKIPLIPYQIACK